MRHTRVGLGLSEFIPPYPKRLPTRPGPIRRILLGRQNLISAFEEKSFSYRFATARMFTRKVFLFNSPEGVQFALSTHNASFERKSPQFRHSLQPVLGDSLFVSDGALWRQRRRIVTPIIHVSRMAEFAPAMVETASEMRDRWSRLPPTAEINIQSEMAELTASIICRSVFGRQLAHDHARDVVEGFTTYQASVGQIDLMSLFGFPDWFPRWRSPRLRRAVQRIHGVLDHVIASHRASEDSDRHAVIGRLIDARDEETGEPLSDTAIRNEAAMLFLAGSETTANALTWTWFLLSQAPDVEARLHQEIDSVLKGRAPTLEDLPHLRYTRAVFEEAMRLYPPVPFLTREALVDEEFNGRKIPKGSIIVVCPWLLHRHQRLWKQPDHFRPERFLEGAEPVSKFAYVPFSIGPRICAGMAFGTTEGVLCIATLAQGIRLRLKDGHVVEPEAKLTLRPRGGVPMHVALRPSITVPRMQAAAATAPVCPMGHG